METSSRARMLVRENGKWMFVSVYCVFFSFTFQTSWPRLLFHSCSKPELIREEIHPYIYDKRKRKRWQSRATNTAPAIVDSRHSSGGSSSSPPPNSENKYVCCPWKIAELPQWPRLPSIMQNILQHSLGRQHGGVGLTCTVTVQIYQPSRWHARKSDSYVKWSSSVFEPFIAISVIEGTPLPMAMMCVSMV